MKNFFKVFLYCTELTKETPYNTLYNTYYYYTYLDEYKGQDFSFNLLFPRNLTSYHSHYASWKK